MTFERFWVTASDNTKLNGWHIIGSDSNKKVLLCHNTNGNMERLMPYASFLYREGFDIYMFDFRSHGNSEKNGSRIMHRIKDDINSVIDHIKASSSIENNFLSLYGFSLGTSACVYACNRPEIKNLVLDSGPSIDLNNAFINMYNRTVGKAVVNISYLTVMFMRLVLDARDSDVKRMINEVKALKKPILFIHGDRDVFIKHDETRYLYELCNSNEKEYLKVEGAHHLTNLTILKQQYIRKVSDFLVR